MASEGSSIILNDSSKNLLAFCAIVQLPTALFALANALLKRCFLFSFSSIFCPFTISLVMEQKLRILNKTNKNQEPSFPAHSLLVFLVVLCICTNLPGSSPSLRLKFLTIYLKGISAPAIIGWIKLISCFFILIFRFRVRCLFQFNSRKFLNQLISVTCPYIHVKSAKFDFRFSLQVLLEPLN